MADHPYYQSPAGVAPGEDPSNRNQVPVQPPYPGQQPAGYPPGQLPHQPGAYYGAAAPHSQQWPAAAYGSPPPLPQQPLQSPSQFGYNAGPQPGLGAPADPSMAGMTSQMSGLGIMGEGAARSSKKKHRHAHHDIAAAPASAQQLPTGPADALNQPSSQFLNTGLNQVPHAGSPAFSAGAGPQPTFGGPPDAAHGTIPTQGSINPEQIPSIPRTRDAFTQYYFSHVYPTMERHLPPPAAVPFVAHDQGNSSPKHARLTLNNIPTSSDFLSSTGLPLGMVLQPFARLDGEPQIPVLDFGEIGPPRCRRCRAYINPFMSFRSGGSKVVCNMCTFPNDVAPEYFAPIDVTGARIDRMQRPELMQGTVDFLVPSEYWNKEPVGLRTLILIDVSHESIRRGFLKGICKGIMKALYDDEASQTPDETTPVQNIPEGSKIGIVTFDREVHFYNLSAELQQAQMMVMTDLQDPFVPLSDGLFVDPYESKHVITSLLEQIPSIFSRVKAPEPVLLPALSSALFALQPTGGKVIGAICSLPTWGPGALKLRDDPRAHGTDAERKLFTTDDATWRETAGKFAEAGIGVDMFIAAPSGTYMDVATIGHIPEVSGGETFFYPNFHAPRDIQKVSEEFAHALTRETGYQALMKVRCSNGLQVSSYHGNFVQHAFGADLEIGAIDADKAIAVLFSYDGKLETKLDAHFQAALLYTSANGQRRVRCMNVVAAVNEGGLDTMKFVDQDAVVSIIAKEAAAKTLDKSLKDIRANITEKTVDIFSGYRKVFSGSHPPGQLVLPENLKEFSMFILGLIKSRAFKGGQETSDRRIHDMRMLRSIGCNELSLYLYPRIIPIHNMQPEDGFPNEQGQLQVPPALRASFSKMEDGGAYLVDDGQQCLLWIHSRVSPNLLEDLFGPEQASLQEVNPQTSSLPVLETHLNAQVRNLLQYFSSIRGSKAVTIQLARQGLDGAEYEFARLLVEDRNNEAQSYVDWLVHIHRQINMELAGRRKREEAATEGSLAGLTGLRAPYW